MLPELSWQPQRVPDALRFRVYTAMSTVQPQSRQGGVLGMSSSTVDAIYKANMSYLASECPGSPFLSSLLPIRPWAFQARCVFSLRGRPLCRPLTCVSKAIC